MKKEFIRFLKKKRMYSKFIKNYKKRGSQYDIQDVVFNPPCKYIIRAFEWGETPEGLQFWWDVETEWLEIIQKGII